MARQTQPMEGVTFNQEGHATGFEGKGIDLYRLAMIASGLRFEINCPGMRLTGNAPKCSTICRKEFGLKGKPPKLLEQIEKILEEAKQGKWPDGYAFIHERTTR